MLEGKKEMTFMDHLEELRWTLLRSAVAVVVFAILAFIFKRIVFDLIILSPKDPDFITNRILCQLAGKYHIQGLCMTGNPVKLVNLSMGGQFVTHITISLISGFIIAFPYVAWEFWRFVSPALYDKEKKYARLTVLYISILFFIGVLMGYYIITPITILFLGSYNVSQQITNTISLSSYIQVTTSIWFASGLIFELPVITYFLAKLGILTSDFMKKYRKYAVVICLFFAAVITPSPDIFSQTLVAIPLYLLYESSIWVAFYVEKRRKLKEETEEIPAG